MAEASRAPAINTMGVLFVVLLIVLYIFLLVLIISVLIRMARYFTSGRKEQKLIRMELGKLADEVHQIREELKEKLPPSQITR